MQGTAATVQRLQPVVDATFPLDQAAEAPAHETAQALRQDCREPLGCGRCDRQRPDQTSDVRSSMDIRDFEVTTIDRAAPDLGGLWRSEIADRQCRQTVRLHTPVPTTPGAVPEMPGHGVGSARFCVQSVWPSGAGVWARDSQKHDCARPMSTSSLACMERTACQTIEDLSSAGCQRTQLSAQCNESNSNC